MKYTTVIWCCFAATGFIGCGGDAGEARTSSSIFTEEEKQEIKTVVKDAVKEEVATVHGRINDLARTQNAVAEAMKKNLGELHQTVADNHRNVLTLMGQVPLEAGATAGGSGSRLSYLTTVSAPAATMTPVLTGSIETRADELKALKQWKDAAREAFGSDDSEVKALLHEQGKKLDQLLERKPSTAIITRPSAVLPPPLPPPPPGGPVLIQPTSYYSPGRAGGYRWPDRRPWEGEAAERLAVYRRTHTDQRTLDRHPPYIR